MSSILEPGRPAKSDKPAILDDAIRVLNQLRTDAQELKETNEKLQEEIKSLKVSWFTLLPRFYIVEFSFFFIICLLWTDITCIIHFACLCNTLQL